ncbi:hypothetical protein Trebr_2579 [Treponema brennaborense DSM 12168]|uniref:YD repeat protein n=2 Tax=Treponema TaxID=157 RepID=F4LP06_TREBD|nr:hypothetical protein Trebr_2579 [Treponema brennaborense DSM 12168]
MKKVIVFLLQTAFLFYVFAQNSNSEPFPDIGVPYGSLNLKAGDEILLPVSGMVQFTNKENNSAFPVDIPENLKEDYICIVFPSVYYYGGEEMNSFYELVFFNVELKSDLDTGSILPVNTVIGTAKADTVCVMLRCIYLDPNLVLLSQNVPRRFGRYWYYGLEYFSPNVMRFLDYQTLDNADQKIDFGGTGQPQSLNDMVNMSNAQEDVICTYPPTSFIIKTKLDKYPEIKDESPAIFDSCTHEMKIDFDGVPLRLFFYQGYDYYLREEYQLNNDIYLYINILYEINREVFCYVRDFSLQSPEDIVHFKLDYIGQVTGENISNYVKSSSPDSSISDDYVDIPLPEFLDTDFAEYERFFYFNEKTGKFEENKNNINEGWYHEDGTLFMHAYFYDDQLVHRIRLIITYDENGNVLSEKCYEAKMYKKDGKWTTDDTQWRMTIKKEYAYENKDSMTVKTGKYYRYSFKPTTEHDDGFEKTETDANNVVRKASSEYGTTGLFDIREYDEYGNIIIARFDNGDFSGDYTYENFYGETGLLIKTVSVNNETGAISEIVYEYDKNGRKTLAKSAFGQEKCVYDSKGNIIETIESENGKEIKRVYYRYDEKTGRLLFKYEVTFGEYANKRFWYYEKTNDRAKWEKNLDPETLLKTLKVY